MRLVIADTGPLNYLVWIGTAEILPKLFEMVLVPQAVQDELCHRGAPDAVRLWASHPPTWLDIRANPVASDIGPGLDIGERMAIALARDVKADLILMDDRQGVTVALGMGIETIGTLGVLDRAARRGLIDLEAAFARLKATNFRFRPETMDALLAQHKRQGTP